jgi:REP element-mobilizing transposase RayT
MRQERSPERALQNREAQTMPQSLVRMLGHVVFSTKQRVPAITESVRPKLYGYMAGILRDEGCGEILIGGVADHVHIACSMSKHVAPVRILEIVKKQSSKWMKEQGPGLERFYWQTGYGLYSVSPSNFDRLLGYIRNQDRHHERMTFQQEFRALLRKHGVAFDERYVWD